MRAAGRVVAQMHEAIRAAARPGVTTYDLDVIAREVIARNGATSNFLGYGGFPGVICASVNDELIHGIPGPAILDDGDVLCIDCGAIIDGWHGDAAFTMGVGPITPEARRLIDVAGGRSPRASPRCVRAATWRTSARRSTRSSSPPDTEARGSTAGTASAGRCTSTPTWRTAAAGVAAGPRSGCGAGDRTDAHRRRRRRRGRPRRRLDGGHRRRIARRPRRAHRRRHGHGPEILTRL